MARSTPTRTPPPELLATAEANTKGPVLTPEQTLLHVCAGRPAGLHRPERSRRAVDAGDRETLDREGLLTTVKREQNALWLKLTDAGWTWSARTPTRPCRRRTPRCTT